MTSGPDTPGSPPASTGAPIAAPPIEVPRVDPPAASAIAGSLASGAPARPAPRPGAGAMAVKPARPRRAKLVVRRVDPWSVLKFSLIFSLCLFIVFVVAVAALYFALDALGVFTSINKALSDYSKSTADASNGYTIDFSAGRVIGAAMVIGLINVVIFTALGTLGAFLYNLCGDIVGGIGVTLVERD